MLLFLLGFLGVEINASGNKSSGAGNSSEIGASEIGFSGTYPEKQSVLSP